MLKRPEDSSRRRNINCFGASDESTRHKAGSGGAASPALDPADEFLMSHCWTWRGRVALVWRRLRVFRAPEKFTWGRGGGLWSPFANPGPHLEGAPRAGSLFSILFMRTSNHWFLISHSKTALPLVGAISYCRVLRAKLEMQAQTSPHPVTMLVPICHTGGEKTAAL